MNSVKAEASYISLFSAGGIGDLGFHDEKFYCVASAELLSKRIEIQRLNHIADSDRLICGDLLLPGTFQRVVELAEEYIRSHHQPITAIIATPPCQGMSVANHKKGDELARNSLVVRSIELIKQIKPLVFIFENVPAFMKTVCTGLDGKNRKIGEEIAVELGGEYEYYSHVLQFCNYGSPSSRTRSLTIGVRNDVTWVTPLDLFPDRQQAPTLKQLIGDLPSLHDMGECSDRDILHTFRPYEERMRAWIHDLKEGESAFDNEDPLKRPHRIINGKLIPNVRKSGDKYKRVAWNSVAPCVHTRNDILASQNTVHPVDDRVFSIRELMRMMGIRKDFIWFEGQEDANIRHDLSLLKVHANNIRQCLGEAIPVPITQSIAKHIQETLVGHLKFSSLNPRCAKNAGWTTCAQKSAYYEVNLSQKKEFAAFYTEPLVAFSLIKRALESIPLKKGREIKILEPSAGSGIFIDIIDQFAQFADIAVTCIEIDKKMYELLEQKKNNYSNIKEINILNLDFIQYAIADKFDIIIGNPPFGRVKKDSQTPWGCYAELSLRFLNKAIMYANYVAFILPKALLHAAYYYDQRKKIQKNCQINNIIDFGEYTFAEVKVETIGLILKSKKDKRNSIVSVKSWILATDFRSSSDYIFDDKFPSWVIYRNHYFDVFLAKIHCGIFNVWRDRSISRRYSVRSGIRVIRGRNLSLNNQIIDEKHDYFISEDKAYKCLKILNSLTGNTKLLAPNLSYYPRIVELSQIGDSAIPDGSCAVLYGDIDPLIINQLVELIQSKEFAHFYRIACNYSTRSINIDKCLVYWWGIPKL